ncbi:MAG: monofunctional biosynthetic peptidoglycan transglycosylase [Acidobacteriota bacterium]|nr:monofunctional biosynthetic peptidoglycan transglycosylase [Acidobacteriota bacterium]
MALPLRRWLGKAIRWIALGLAVGYALCALSILSLRWINPITTSVQAQRRLEAMMARRPYSKRYQFVPLSRISTDLQHAVIAAEDGRFWRHHGFDWQEVHKVMERDLERGRLGRGASTITQQLVKNLFLSTQRSVLRKGIEASLVPVAEVLLGKNRILELYLNVIEWGPGVYGAEAASEYWDHAPAAQVGRQQAARLAAIIPNPRKRRPDRMDDYSSDILTRMSQLGW